MTVSIRKPWRQTSLLMMVLQICSINAVYQLVSRSSNERLGTDPAESVVHLFIEYTSNGLPPRFGSDVNSTMRLAALFVYSSHNSSGKNASGVHLPTSRHPCMLCLWMTVCSTIALLGSSCLPISTRMNWVQTGCFDFQTSENKVLPVELLNRILLARM